ncbi:MAG: hypothetical protein H6735_10950 [Alphaproteobacteria bacterium]|nr:hypothetical protein [Alphaproteobacteria bacterium]
MGWFEGTYTETLTLAVPAAVARAHFADPAAIVAATKAVERSEIDGGRIHFVIAEENHGVVKFQADYTCTYTLDGDTVRWSTDRGCNCQQSGTARVVEAGSGCTLTYSETIAVDLPVPRLMAPAVRPLVGPMIAKEIGAYLKRLVATLPTG